MRKCLTIAIPIVTLILFVCIMLSGSLLKKPLGKNNGIPQAIDEIIQDVNNEAWDEVSKGTDDLEKVWKKVIFRVQFSSERDEINYFSTNIARLRGAIMAEDRSDALMELNEAYNHWKQLGE